MTSTDIWINGGFFVLRNEIFSQIYPGDELVRQPFQRLIERQALLAYKYTGFWQCMDTFKDKQRLEELNQSRGAMESVGSTHGYDVPSSDDDGGRRMIQLHLEGARPGGLNVLCLGCHSDDIEIGCGGTVLRLADAIPGLYFRLGGLFGDGSP